MRTVPLVLLILAVGCGDGASLTFPDRDPTIVGRIVARDVWSSSWQGRPTIHVKEGTEEECGGIIFAVGTKTPIKERMSDGSVRDADVDDLVPNQDVAVWTTVVLESCPGQAEAEAIEVLRP